MPRAMAVNAYSGVYDAGSDRALRAGVPRGERRTVQRSPRVPSRGCRRGDRRDRSRRRPGRAAGRRGRRRSGPRWAPILIADPGSRRPAPGEFGRDGRGGRRAARRATSRTPPHPFTAAARERVATFDRDATDPGRRHLRRGLPATAGHRSGGVETAVGSIGFGWPAPGEPRRGRARDADRASPASRPLAVDRARIASTAAERSEWFERLAHSDPLTGLANERTVGARPGARARACRPPGERGLAGDVRHRRLPGDEPRRRPCRRRRRPASRSPPSWPSRSGSWTPSAGSAATSSSLIAPGSAASPWPTGSWPGLAALPAVAGKDVSVSAGVARFPADGGQRGRAPGVGAAAPRAPGPRARA